MKAGRAADEVADACNPPDGLEDFAVDRTRARNRIRHLREIEGQVRKRMKFFLVAPLLEAASFLPQGGSAGRGDTGARAPAGETVHEATHVSGDTVAGCAKAATLFAGPEYTVICYNRSAPGRAEAHAGHAHIWYIVEGEATLVTGGTILNATADAPGEPRGSSIDGGHARRLAKGDVIVIPAGVPHQYTEVRSPVAYYSVNVNR
jgi:mannose-6-phosphate isomerase-like protein (cupin superfamily)